MGAGRFRAFACAHACFEQVARAATVALPGVPCVTLARSEVPREELESEDRACLPDISHHARAGLACNERHEPLGASYYASRRLAGRRTIVGHGHLLGGGVVGDLRREVDACFFLLRRSCITHLRSGTLCLRPVYYYM